ncbi:MAG: FkbM family methyltransferase [Clostridia bacterium]|nr:FkbM family methyltransferase [Clostridia bacterium]
MRYPLPPTPFPQDLWDYLRVTEKPILVYGMGNGADKLISRLGEVGKTVADFFASDGFVRGQSFHGRRVLTYGEAKEKHGDAIVLVSFGSDRENVLDTVFSLAEQAELYIPDMPLAGEEYFTAAFYRAHYEELARVYEMLADEASKVLFCALLWYKLTGKPEYLKSAVCTGDEEELLAYARIKSAVDVGAYRGDTLCELIERAQGLRTVFAIEPDKKNYEKLLRVAEGYEGYEIVCHHAAAWCEDGELSFAASGNRNATIGTLLGATASHEHRVATVKSIKIDTITQGRNIDYIKYDTEGAEREALLGSRATIEREVPFLRISVYHRTEDLFALVRVLCDLTKRKYDFYLRRRLCIPAWEIELIAVPCERPTAQRGEGNA